MKSLLIVGLPRGLTSKSYDIACESLHGILKHFPKKDVPAGEVLNFLPPNPEGKVPLRGRFFGSDNEMIDNYLDYLLGFEEGHVLKDVAQPFVVQRLLERHPGKFNVLRIRRDIRDVAYAMSMRKWLYPIRALRPEWTLSEERVLDKQPISDETLTSLIRGVQMADAALDCAFTAEFKAITTDESTIPSVLREMGYNAAAVRYIDTRFTITRSLRENNVRQKYWQKIDRIIREMK